MKIERLKQKSKKPIIIGTILTVVIGGALTFKLTHSKYRVTQSIDLGSGVINYKVPDFKIMAMYKNDGSGDVSIDSMPTSGYVINEEKTYCQTSSGNEVKGKIKTISGIHGISGLNKGDKCYLYFDKKTSIDVYDIIATIKASSSYKGTVTPDFSKNATTDEGVYSVNDEMYGGTTYYWRGAASTNYVKFAGYCWRMIRINGDKTIRMIYDGTTCHANGTSTAESIAVTSQAYNPNYNQSNYVGWTYEETSQRTTGGTNSNAKAQTESWYNSHIGNNVTYNSKVADGKFCNNRNTGSGITWSINGSDFDYEEGTNIDNGTPSISSCPSGDVYNLKIGAITADEVIYAGGTGTNSPNSSYYLYNGQTYVTMSPCDWSNGYATVFAVNSLGYLSYVLVNTRRGIRPVINLKADTTFATGGTGTKSNPYTVSTSSGGQTSSSK